MEAMLRKLYCDIISLDKILPEICCTNQELLNFCSNILVTKDNKKSELQIPTTICENYDIETSLHYIIEVLLEFTSKDILTHEYHPVIPNECSIIKSQQIKNDIVLMITSCPYWNMIYDRIDKSCFYELFLHNAIYVPLSDDTNCYIQITGYPIYKVLKDPQTQRIYTKSFLPTCLRLSNLHSHCIDLKKLLYNNQNPTDALNDNSTISEHLCWLNSDPPHADNAYFSIHKSLPFSGILSSLDSGKGSIALACAIFQNGSENSSKKKIKKIIQVSERLNLKALIHNHQCFNYTLLLSKHTSSQQVSIEFNHLNSEEVVETLVNLYDTPVHQVINFVRDVLLRVFPDISWGNTKNRQTLFKGIARLLTLNSTETISIRDIIKGLKVSDYSWLRNKNTRAIRAHPPPSQSQQEEEMLCLWVKWIIEDYVIPLLKSYFYITERGGSTRNALFFYTKYIWKTIRDLSLSDMKTSGMILRIFPEEISSLIKTSKALGIASLRFQPKSSGVRRITNLGHTPRNAIQGTEGRTVNARLHNVLQVFNYEAVNSPDVLGSSVLGFDDIYEKWKPFVINTKDKQTESKRYMISVDIKGCFDSIDTDMLINILKRRLSQSCYNIRKFVVIKRDREGQMKIFWKRAADGETMRPFSDFILSCYLKCNSSRNGIIVDQMTCVNVDRKYILKTLKNHLKNNIIMINKEYYRQVQGIPQGSVLSTLLCSFFYAEMEKQFINDIIGNEGLLMRLVDDFILVTSSSSVARQFYHLMTEGIEEFQCYINTNKTVKNFEVDEEDGEVRIIEEMEWFPWCGILINTRSLDLRVDYNRYTHTNIRDCVTVITHSKPFTNLFKKTLQSVIIRCMPLLLDSQSLSELSIACNVYENFVLQGMKFHSHVRRLNSGGQTDLLAPYLIKILLRSGSHFYQCAVKRCQKKGQKKSLFTMSYHICSWLSLHAFGKVLQKKQSRYKRLLKLIRNRLVAVQKRINSDDQMLLQDTVKEVEGSSVFNIKY